MPGGACFCDKLTSRYPFAIQQWLPLGNLGTEKFLLAADGGGGYIRVSDQVIVSSFKNIRIMAKHVAVLAVNPVNGMGLFQYLENFYEHKIDYTVFAVAPTVGIHANCGIALQANATIDQLKGQADRYDALVFSCGDAVPVFQQHASEPHNVALFEVIREFAGKGKLLIGHCAAAMMFDLAGVCGGRRVAVHPLAKPAIQKGVATDEPFEIDGPVYTAQTEHTLPLLMPAVLEALA